MNSRKHSDGQQEEKRVESQFQRYINGLIVSENKPVDGINHLCVHESRNQSSLNRLLAESPFSTEALNQVRLALLDRLPGTQVKRQGVFSLDDTLLTHYGQHFQHIAYLYDPAQEGCVSAHNLVAVHYSDDDIDYPVLFQSWKPVDLDKLERGLLAAGIRLRESKQALKTEAPHKWRQYSLGAWRQRQNKPTGCSRVIRQHTVHCRPIASAMGPGSS